MPDSLIDSSQAKYANYASNSFSKMRQAFLAKWKIIACRLRKAIGKPFDKFKKILLGLSKAFDNC